MQVIAYSLTKPLKLNNVFNNNGVYKFVLQEVNSTDDDNFELMIADYYKHFPKDGQSATDPQHGDDQGQGAGQSDNTTDSSDTGRKVWL